MKKFLAQVDAPYIQGNGFFAGKVEYKNEWIIFLEAEDKQVALAELLKFLPEKNAEILRALADKRKTYSKVPMFRGGTRIQSKAKPYNNEYYVVILLEISRIPFCIPRYLPGEEGYERFEI